MATLKSDSKEVEIPDGQAIIGAAEELGVPFGCTNGLCGTCTTVVKAGMENLAPRNEKEEAMGLSDNERLMCQCKINNGTVHIEVF